VHIRLDASRHLEVDHKADILHIDTPTGEIRSHKHIAIPIT
jgi:hypothetical protein